MGNTLQFQDKKKYVLMCGLSNSGKTTILNSLQLSEIETITPMMGLHISQVSNDNICFTSWDVGGNGRIRALWKHYYKKITNLVFVIDSCKIYNGIEDAKTELHFLLKEEALKDLPLLIFANKRDLENILSIEDIIDKLELKQTNHKWCVIECIATTGEGLEKGLQWIENPTDLNPSIYSKVKSARK